MPLYLNGSQLLAQMGSAPILDGMALVIVATSYNGVLAISPTSSPAVMPDLDHFTELLWRSANDLEAAIDAVCSMRMVDYEFLQLAGGKLDGPGAFMSGKLKVKGDIKAAIGFGKVLAALVE